MEKRIKCQICNRSFSNRKALGGHMKSHFVKAPLAAAAAQPPPPPTHRYGFHQVITQQSRDLYSRHMQHSNRHSVSIDSDNFSDNTTRSSNCTASPPPQQPPEAQTSVVSATSPSPEEDAARCLVMLSRGVWDEDHSAVGVLFSNYDDDCDGDYELEQIEEDEETLAYYSSSDERESSFIKPPASKYKCETCNKEFKSYQALGGHRSSHSNSNNLANNHRIFKCSYCSRVFESGQALGGHKKVHSMFAKNSIDDRGMIDLNNIPVEDREFNDKFESFISYDSLLH